jgi:hypothetical protein
VYFGYVIPVVGPLLRLGRLLRELRLGHITTNEHHIRIKLDLDESSELQADVIALRVVKVVSDSVLRVGPRQRLVIALASTWGSRSFERYGNCAWPLSAITAQG